MNVDATALKLINLLYQGLEDDTAFGAFAEALAASLGAAATALSLNLDPERLRAPTSTYGFDPGFVKQYEAYYHDINIHNRMGAHLFTPGAVLFSEESCPKSVLLSSEYYNDFLRPQKFLHAIGTVVDIGPTQTSMLSVYPGQNTDSRDAESLVRALVPHLQRVNRLGAQLGVARTGAHALNALPVGVVVVTSKCRVTFMNSAAERLLARGDGLDVSSGILRATQTNDNLKLKLAINAACSLDPSLEKERVPMSFLFRMRSGSESYQVTVGRFLEARGLASSSAILFIRYPTQATLLPEKAMAQLYGLTPAESRLANLLVSGGSLAIACDQLRIRRNTGRAHLRSIFAKVGVRSQSQLVAQMSRVLAPF